MIKYEVHVTGKENPYFSFESHYQISSQERIFVNKAGVNVSLVVVKITHDITKGEHVVRLNCMFKKSHA